MLSNIPRAIALAVRTFVKTMLFGGNGVSHGEFEELRKVVQRIERKMYRAAEAPKQPELAGQASNTDPILQAYPYLSKFGYSPAPPLPTDQEPSNASV